jgi:hypothetical protein
MQYNNPFKLGTRRFEIVDLCKIFLPSWSRHVYALVSLIYIWSILYAYSTPITPYFEDLSNSASRWSYGNVFGTSLTSLIPFPGVSAGEACDFFTGQFGQPCINAYYIYMAFFAVAVVPLCLLDLSDQVIAQVVRSPCPARPHVFSPLIPGFHSDIMFLPLCSDHHDVRDCCREPLH